MLPDSVKIYSETQNEGTLTSLDKEVGNSRKTMKFGSF